MEGLKKETIREEKEIKLLREWLPIISDECRAYIKGATQALLYAQKKSQKQRELIQLPN